MDHFPQAAWLFMQHELQNLPAGQTLWKNCGVLQLLQGNLQREREKISRLEWPATEWQYCHAAAAAQFSGIPDENFPADSEAVAYPGAGWLDAVAWCHHLLAQPGIRVKTNSAAHRLHYRNSHWEIQDANGHLLAESPVVIIANALGAQALSVTAHLPLQAIGGQISLTPPSLSSTSLRCILCHDGYMTPVLPSGQHCLGATFHPHHSYAPDNDDSTDNNHFDEHDRSMSATVSRQDNEENRRQLAHALPHLADSLPDTSNWQGRTAWRAQTMDYLPLLGPLAHLHDFQRDYAGLRDGKRLDYPPLKYLPGLYVNLGHGSKGFTHAALAAEILAADIQGEPAPVSQKTLDALHPLRFWLRQLKRGG
jgi:tRNA 5-methylaminomethyl-2-thiouridine biosynthesis bifunctional protein